MSDKKRSETDDDSATVEPLPSADDVVEIPIDGVLDLHLFRPRDIRTLIPDYLVECHRRGITAVRIIHGKGTGSLQKGVHALLQRSSLVVHYRLADSLAGGWGATLVDLVPPTSSASAPGAFAADEDEDEGPHRS